MSGTKKKEETWLTELKAIVEDSLWRNRRHFVLCSKTIASRQSLKLLSNNCVSTFCFLTRHPPELRIKRTEMSAPRAISCASYSRATTTMRSLFNLTGSNCLSISLSSAIGSFEPFEIFCWFERRFIRDFPAELFFAIVKILLFREDKYRIDARR